MNKVILMGRLTADPEVRYTTGETASAIARFNVAVNRDFKNKDGNYDADFITCVAFGKTGELVEKYWRKGMQALITGRLQNNHYTDREGKKHFDEQVTVEKIEFTEPKKEAAEEPQQQIDFVALENMSDENLPFEL